MPETTWTFKPQVDKPNPFDVLRLSTHATSAEISERGDELSNSARTREEQLQYRWAVEQLITHPMTRLAHEMLEVPDAVYDDEEWERFAKRFKRPPVDLQSLVRASRTPTPADFNYGTLIELIVERLLQPPAADIRAVLEHPPVVADCGPPPLEVKDVLFG